jgi:hypothetical protein
MAAPKARVFLSWIFGINLGLGRIKSDQFGFLPILSLIFCLLIYERQERANYATPIWGEKDKRLFC